MNQDRYEVSMTEMRCAVGMMYGSKVEVELYHGSALSPFLVGTGHRQADG